MANKKACPDVNRSVNEREIQVETATYVLDWSGGSGVSSGMNSGVAEISLLTIAGGENINHNASMTLCQNAYPLKFMRRAVNGQ